MEVQTRNRRAEWLMEDFVDISLAALKSFYVPRSTVIGTLDALKVAENVLEILQLKARIRLRVPIAVGRCVRQL